MSRNPFAFLEDMSRDAVLLTILQAIIRKNGGEIRFKASDLMAIDPGDAMFKYLNDKGDELVVRFARKGAEAYFVPEDQSSKPDKSRSTGRVVMPRSEQPDGEQPKPRHAEKSDLELYLMEQDRSSKQVDSQSAREREVRRQAGMAPWVTRSN